MLFCPAQGGEEYARQNRNDGDNHQQFNQCECSVACRTLRRNPIFHQRPDTTNPPRTVKTLPSNPGPPKEKPQFGGDYKSRASLVFARSVPPHPSPLPQGEGASSAAHSTTRAAWTCRNAVLGSPSPRGRGLG